MTENIDMQKQLSKSTEQLQIAIEYHNVKTRDGFLCLYAKRGVLFSDVGRPILLIIHGTLRHAGTLSHWIQFYDSEFDIVFVDLPGHGRSPSIAIVTIESFAANVGDAITAALGNRPVVILGESLGGLVAFAIGGLNIKPVQGVIAADPPLTMAKMWHVRADLGNALASNPANEFLRSFALNIFGIGSEGSTHERIYYPLIEQARVPILILTGDVPLFPVRKVNAVPCLVDEVDRYVVSRLAGDNAQFIVVPGCGHLLLVDAAQKCSRIIASFYDRIQPLTIQDTEKVAT